MAKVLLLIEQGRIGSAASHLAMIVSKISTEEFNKLNSLLKALKYNATATGLRRRKPRRRSGNGHR